MKRLVAVLLTMAALACRGPVPAAMSPAPPVILISVDTLRSDHLPAYGYRGVRTPAIDALRRDSILVARAWSHVPLTLPSHVTILTGLLPTATQVRNNLGFRLPWDLPTLPALLRARGYATGAAVSSFVLRGSTGLAASFDWYDDRIDAGSNDLASEAQRSGAATVAAALPWIAGRASKPFFFFLHLYEPHAPYAPPEPFRSQTSNPYDGEIATADAAVGAFLAELKRLQLYDRAIIVFLSDHGEGLGDHGEEEHGILVYREALQVPLMIKLPRSARGGTTLDADAGLADVAPTIAALTGVALTRTSGIDLLGTLPPRRDLYAESYYPRLQLGWHELTSLLHGPRHLIRGGGTELYDLGPDPAEHHNLAAEDRRDAASMAAALEVLKRDLVPLQTIDPESARKLAALGYVGSTAVHGCVLPDPKDAIAQLPQIRAAYAASLAHHWREAAGRWRELAVANPSNVDAWSHLAEAQSAAGDHDGAVAAAQKAIAASAAATGELPLDAAAILLRARRLDEAKRYAEAAGDANPQRAHELLARVALAKGDLDAADREAALALREGDQPSLHLLAAEISARRGDLGKASVQLAGLEGAKLPRLDFVRGDLYARQEKPAEAEAALRREIAGYPDDLDAWANLAVVLALQGRAREADRVLREMVARNPGKPAREMEAKTIVALRGGR